MRLRFFHDFDLILMNDFDRAVIVAMSVVMKMKPAVNEVIEMIAVRNLFMPTGVVSALTFDLMTFSRVHTVDRNHTFIDVRLVNRVQMPVVNKIVVISMPNLRVTATGSVNVIVIFMNLMRHKYSSPEFQYLWRGSTSEV